jgi:RNA-binding protein PNO1
MRRPDEFATDVTTEATTVPLPNEADGELIDMSLDPVAAAQDAPVATEDTPMTDESGRPKFPAAKSIPLAFRREQRKVPIPPHRLTPLKNSWPKIYPPLVEHLHLQVRMNTKTKSVELRTSASTTDMGALQKGEDFGEFLCHSFPLFPGKKIS